MNIFIGLSVGLVFFLCLCAAMYVGYKLAKMQKPKELTVEEKQAEKIKLMNEGMQNIMNYDVSVAMRKRGD